MIEQLTQQQCCGTTKMNVRCGRKKKVVGEYWCIAHKEQTVCTESPPTVATPTYPVQNVSYEIERTRRISLDDISKFLNPPKVDTEYDSDSTMYTALPFQPLTPDDPKKVIISLIINIERDLANLKIALAKLQ
jgi:hypothetical protein